jgi:hypothetical protein
MLSFEESILRRKNIGKNPIAIMFGFCLLGTASCGDFGPYKSGGKKCKVNCESSVTQQQNKEPRNTPKFEANIDTWSNKLVPLKMDIELTREVVQTNAPSLAFSALALPWNLAKDTEQISSETGSASEKCLFDKVNNQPIRTENNWEKLEIDYGKCFSFEQLEAAANAKKTSGEGLKRYELYERSVDIWSPVNSEWNRDSIVNYLLSVFSFLNEKKQIVHETHLTTASQSQFYVSNGANRTQSKEVITVLGLGAGTADNSKPFKVTRQDSGYEFNGSMRLLYASGLKEKLGAAATDAVSYRLDYEFDKFEILDSGFRGIIVMQINSESYWGYTFENSCTGSVYLYANVGAKDAQFSSNSEGKFVGNVRFCEN